MSDPSSEAADYHDNLANDRDSRVAERQPVASVSVPPPQLRRSYSVSPGPGPGHNDMTTLRRSKTTSVEVLQEAFDSLQTDASQLPVADLIQAASLARDLHGVLQDKLRRKLES